MRRIFGLIAAGGIVLASAGSAGAQGFVIRGNAYPTGGIYGNTYGYNYAPSAYSYSSGYAGYAAPSYAAPVYAAAPVYNYGYRPYGAWSYAASPFRTGTYYGGAPFRRGGIYRPGMGLRGYRW